MAKSKRIAYAEYEGNYRKPLDDLLQQSRPGKSSPNRTRLLNELQASYETVTAVYVTGKKMWEVWCDRLALAARILYWDFQLWTDSMAGSGGDQQDKLDRLAQLEKEAEQQEEAADQLEAEVEDKPDRFHQYRQALEEYNNTVHEIKVLQEQINNPRQHFNRLSHIQKHVETCETCLNALVESFQAPPVRDLHAVVGFWGAGLLLLLLLSFDSGDGVKDAAGEESIRRLVLE